MARLNGTSGVITGASRGIGRAIARACAREGSRVVVNYLGSRERAEDVVSAIRAGGGEAVAVGADVGSPEGIRTLVDAAMEEYGAIDFWVNNAGADILTGAGADLPEAEKLQRLMDIDLRGTMNCCWAVAPLMKSRGRGVILNMSWDLSVHGLRDRNPQMFAAVKAGVLGFSKSLALECAPEVRVNVLAPGWIATEFAEQGMDRDYQRAREGEIPLGRFGRPEEVAEVAVFLVSDEASYVTGQVVNINGGLA